LGIFFRKYFVFNIDGAATSKWASRFLSFFSRIL
jgi:hypothetical protein